MLKGNFKFVVCNPSFAVLLGVVYWLFGLLAVHLRWDGFSATLIAFFVGFWVYTKRQEGRSPKVLALAAMNALVHSLAVLLIATVFFLVNARYLDLAAWPRFSFVLFAVEMIVAGGLAAGALVGLYLYASSRWWNQSHNDAFSAIRLDSHRNFLRMRIQDDHVTVYPVGLDRIPKRHEWRLNTEQVGSPPPAYVPASPLTPRLIERPFVVRSPPHR
jgi:hypothetical protein